MQPLEPKHFEGKKKKLRPFKQEKYSRPDSIHFRQKVEKIEHQSRGPMLAA